MKVRISDEHVYVELSERNLRDLVAQMEDTRMFGRAPCADLHRRDGDLVLHVEVAGDEAHYGDRRPGIGSGLVDREESA